MLEFKNVSIKYGQNEILHNISFSLENHKITAILGKNGCGKSSLVSAINGTAKYTGEITCFDRNVSLMPIREKAQNIAVLPQILRSPSLTAEELVRLGRSPYLDIGKRLSVADEKWVETAINMVGINELRYKSLANLSGGERQKAYLAMILAQNTRIIILDEPTTYMDMEYKTVFFETLKVLKEKYKKTIMIVMHDLSDAINIADNIVFINETKIAFNGTAKDCAESGIIEGIFGVSKFVFTDEEKQKIFYC